MGCSEIWYEVIICPLTKVLNRLFWVFRDRGLAVNKCQYAPNRASATALALCVLGLKANITSYLKIVRNPISSVACRSVELAVIEASSMKFA